MKERGRRNGEEAEGRKTDNIDRNAKGDRKGRKQRKRGGRLREEDYGGREMKGKGKEKRKTEKEE